MASKFTCQSNLLEPYSDFHQSPSPNSNFQQLAAMHTTRITDACRYCLRSVARKWKQRHGSHDVRYSAGVWCVNGCLFMCNCVHDVCLGSCVWVCVCACVCVCVVWWLSTPFDSADQAASVMAVQVRQLTLHGPPASASPDMRK